MIVSAELDRLIREKRLQLRDALAAYQKSREGVAHAHSALAGIAPEGVTAAQAEIQRLESEEQVAATRFNSISEELAHLHRQKFGDWHITWRGPRVLG